MFAKLRNKLWEFITEEDGMGTVEVILIIVEILTYRYMYI